MIAHSRWVALGALVAVIAWAGGGLSPFPQPAQAVTCPPATASHVTVPAVPGTDAAGSGTGCAGGVLRAAATGPAQWDGYQNGRIPLTLLAPIPWEPGLYLRADAEAALSRLDAAYSAAFGHDIVITSAYRDYQDQVAARTYWCGLGACGNAAVPGTSNHGWGVAVDIGENNHTVIGYVSPTYAWMKAHGAQYGWVHPAWAEPGGVGPHEAWHFEFDGSATDPVTPDPPTPNPPAAAVTSLDEPGYVLALDGAGTVWAYPLSPQGAWGPRVVVARDVSGTGGVFAVGGLSGRTHTDLLATDASSGAVRLYRGRGGTGSGAPSTLGVNWKGMLSVTSGGNATGDGRPVVYTLTATHELLLWRGNGQGGFSRPTPVPGNWSSVDLISGGTDLTGDGVPDLITRSADGTLTLHAGDGRGGFSRSFTSGTGWQAMTAVFSPGDVTGDGRADVLARTTDGTLLAYANTGTGALTRTAAIGVGWQAMTAVSGPAPAAETSIARPAGAGDVNGDGPEDVVAVDAAGALRLYPGDGRGAWLPPTTPVPSWGDAEPVPLGDFSGSGYSDLGAIGPNGAFLLYRGDGVGGYRAPTPIGSGWSGMTAVTGGVDFDGDGYPDILARNAQGQLLLYRGNGAGGWATGGGTVVGTGWNGYSDLFTTNDFDGAGEDDLVARAPDGSLRLYPITGHGTFGTPQRIGVGWQAMTAIFSPGDFDGDGHPDILARTPAGQLLLYRGNGAGGWMPDNGTAIGQGWSTMRHIH